MRVLVTGNLGYIGVILAPLLQRSGHDVVGFDNDLYSDCDFGPAAETVPTIIGDIRDVTAHQLEGFDAVIHLAALSNDPLGDIDPDLTNDINYRATVRLARAAKAAGVKRFVFSSSCSNYGASQGGWLTEMSPLNPVTPYAVSKLRSEEALDKLADDDFCPIYLRSGIVTKCIGRRLMWGATKTVCKSVMPRRSLPKKCRTPRSRLPRGIPQTSGHTGSIAQKFSRSVLHRNGMCAGALLNCVMRFKPMVWRSANLKVPSFSGLRRLSI
jgi:hypothetical protein